MSDCMIISCLKHLPTDLKEKFLDPVVAGSFGRLLGDLVIAKEILSAAYAAMQDVQIFAEMLPTQRSKHKLLSKVLAA